MKTGVVLLNMGGPSSLEQVLPFLTGLFNDPRILGIRNGLVRKALASYIISRRLPTAISHYELIGGKSPLLEHTEKLAPKVEQELAQLGIEAMVAAGMRYLEPRTPATVQQLVEKGCSRIIGFSMYPHYSLSTTGSSVEDFQQATQDIQGVQTHLVESYPDERFYIAAMRQKIDQALQKCQHKPLLLFCAHSLPESLSAVATPIATTFTARFRRCWSSTPTTPTMWSSRAAPPVASGWSRISTTACPSWWMRGMKTCWWCPSASPVTMLKPFTNLRWSTGNWPEWWASRSMLSSSA